MLLIIPLFANPFFNNEGFNNDNKGNDAEENEVVKYDIISALYLIMLGYNANYYYRWGIMDNICIVLLYILTLIISIFAAYLSFTCNWVVIDNNVFVKLLFALIAFLLGPLYLIWFFFVNYLGNLC
jgi:hypothetical protein